MRDIKQIIANNIIELRKHNNLTQNELAKKLNYSDNTISRWEHAEITPSVENLELISETFNVPIEELFKENITENVKKNNKNIFINKLATALLLAMSIWLVAIIVFIYADTILKVNYWMVFIWAIPTTCLALLYFCKYWKNKIYGFVVSSVFVWTILLSFYLQLIQYNIFLIFIIGIPVQAALSIWTFVKKE